MADISRPYEAVEPVHSVEPTHCPACLSGLQPVEPPYEKTIDPRY